MKKLILVCLTNMEECLLEILFSFCLVFPLLMPLTFQEGNTSPPQRFRNCDGTIWKVYEKFRAFVFCAIIARFLIKFFIGWYIALYLCQFFSCLHFFGLPSLNAFLRDSILGLNSVENWSRICSSDNWKCSGGKKRKNKHFQVIILHHHCAMLLGSVIKFHNSLKLIIESFPFCLFCPWGDPHKITKPNCINIDNWHEICFVVFQNPAFVRFSRRKRIKDVVEKHPFTKLESFTFVIDQSTGNLNPAWTSFASTFFFEASRYFFMFELL